MALYNINFLLNTDKLSAFGSPLLTRNTAALNAIEASYEAHCIAARIKGEPAPERPGTDFDEFSRNNMF